MPLKNTHCPICGTALKANQRGKPKEYCSPHCAKIAYERRNPRFNLKSGKLQYPREENLK